MEKYFDTLIGCPLFFDIEPDELGRLLRCLDAKVDSFDKKYTVMAEGSRPRHIGIMLSGSAQITRTDYYGNRSILSNVEKGEMFAEAFACADLDELPVSVTANEPCEIMFIERSHIMQTCKNSCSFHNRLIFNLMKDLAEKNIMFHRRAEITSKRSTREKLMTYLLGCAKNAGSSSFEIPFDRQELADYLEVERSGLSSEISKLRSEGIIESTKKQFTLL